MLLNGLVTGVHSSADNIVAAATKYSMDIGVSEKKRFCSFLTQMKSYFLGIHLAKEHIGHATENVFCDFGR